MKINNIERAYLIAEKAHAGQTYDIYPYMYHIRMVAETAKSFYPPNGSKENENIVIASILHDVLEDSELSYNNIKKAFNEEIAEIVYAVTDEMGRNRKERKEKTYPKLKQNEAARCVKLCDRICNVQHSKYYNQRMFEMYKKEYPKFKEELNLGGKLEYFVWNHLDILMK